MALDRTTPELAFLRALVPEPRWATLESAVSIALRAGDGAARQSIDAAPLPDGERQLLRLAYSLWRGVGPALDVESLWGLEPDDAARLLFGLALAVDRGRAADVLAAASALAAAGAQTSQDG